MGGITMKAKEAIGKYINYRQSLGELFKTNSSILRSFARVSAKMPNCHAYQQKPY